MVRLGVFMAALSCLLLTLQVPAYAQAVDGFLGVPWGASKNQVVKAMEDRGFPVRPPFDNQFTGEFAGYQGANLAFFLERNSFYWAQASICHTPENTGYPEVQSCGQNLENMIRSKYGTPAGRRQTHSNAYEITWGGVRNSTGSDEITISLWVCYPDPLNGGIVQVNYKNNSLLRRLKQAGASDL